MDWFPIEELTVHYHFLLACLTVWFSKAAAYFGYGNYTILAVLSDIGFDSKHNDSEFLPINQYFQ